MRRHFQHLARVGQGEHGDIAQQAQFGRQRIDFARLHGWQLQADAMAAGMADGGFFRRMEGRRDGRERSHGHVLRERLQHHAHIGHGILVDGAAQAVAVELHLEDILGRQKGVDVFRRQRHLALTDAVEQRLEDMRHLAHVGEAERRCATLDRMGGTEDGIQVFGVGRRNINGQQQPFLFSQQFFGLIEKDLKKLANIDGHRVTPSIASLHCAAGISRSPS